MSAGWRSSRGVNESDRTEAEELGAFCIFLVLQEHRCENAITS